MLGYIHSHPELHEAHVLQVGQPWVSHGSYPGGAYDLVGKGQRYTDLWF